MTETAREAVARAIVREIGYADQICEFDDAAAVAVVVLAAYHAWLDAHGWQIVPKEPTDEIKRAGLRCWSPEMNDQQTTGVDPVFDAYLEDMAEGYRAMLAAAPKPPGE